jgi:transcriptional regulator with XRE-family HTH domain
MQQTHPIALRRADQGLSQEALAELVGCKRWMINRIENGKRQPSVRLTARIAAVTGLSREVLRPDIFAEAAE